MGHHCNQYTFLCGEAHGGVHFSLYWMVCDPCKMCPNKEQTFTCYSANTASHLHSLLLVEHKKPVQER